VYGASRRAGRGKVDPLGAPGRSVRRHDAYVNVAEQFYDSIFDIHGKGVLYTARQSFPLLPKGASIILNLSIFGVKGLSSKSVYSTTKLSFVGSHGRCAMFPVVSVSLKNEQNRSGTSVSR
jgi:hypothetical protein